MSEETKTENTQGNGDLAVVMPRCIYCNGEATNKMHLISVYAPGTYFQHWDVEKQKGCSKNKENISPSGKRVNVV